jgi:hypothetical protein
MPAPPTLTTMNTDSRCLLCHRRPQYLGLFLPYRPAHYGGRHVCSYALCKRCYKRPAAARDAAVEARLAQQRHGRWN